jgi:hypothetical protein
MPRARHRLQVAVAIALLLLVACATRGGGGFGASLEPRFIAVHNALAAMGLAQIGPIEEGSLAQGREVRLAWQLPAGCVAIVVVGGEGLRDVDAILLDSRGTPLAHDTTNEPQAVLRPCLDAADTYMLVVKAAAGAGSWVAATWAGGVASNGPPATSANPANAPEAKGTCEAPIVITAGTVTGSTTRGEHENAGSCGPSDSREIVYQLDVPERQRVSIEVEARFDSVLYLRKDDCADANAEIDCNDDAPDRTRSRLERVLEPGKYFVFVDGYGHEAGPFKMTVAVTDVLALADVCHRAAPLPTGVLQSATTAGMADDVEATCGGGAEGADSAWRVEIASRSRVRITEHSDDVTPVVHVRRACPDGQSEVACADSGVAAGAATVTGVFDAGTYTVFADAHGRDSAGRYTLLLETAPVAGSGVNADACGDAAPLGGGPSGSVTGDTFAAHDDVAGSCGGTGAADVVYRLDVAKRSRLVASLDDEEGPHVLVAWRRCAERGAEVACGRVVDDVVAPGTYFIAVDGASPDALGRFTLQWALRDLTAQGSACGTSSVLVDGRSINASTIGAGDRFVASCGASANGGSGPDRVFRIELPVRATVRVAVVAATFDAVIALRRTCGDVAGGAASAELACESDSDVAHRTAIERTLEAGTYWLIVDGQSPNDQGPFTLEYRVVR